MYWLIIDRGNFFLIISEDAIWHFYQALVLSQIIQTWNKFKNDDYVVLSAITK